MLNKIYKVVVVNPKLVLIITALLTIFFASQLDNLRWETDARVYLPKGHSAILYDEKVADVFGVKDAVIIGIENDNGIFNPESLARIARITEKVAALPGVIAGRTIDVVSLSTATLFIGTDTAIGAQALMQKIPESDAEIEALKKLVYDNADLFVGNIVSADGTATMVRARLKEGIANRYMTYWQIRGIVDAELGKSSDDWQQWQGDADNSSKDSNWEGGQQWGGESDANAEESTIASAAQKQPVTDKLYIAGRPAIEVASGLHAIEDMELMIPLLGAAMAIALFIIFRTRRGVFIPVLVVAISIVWTMGLMAALDVPLYTISTMLPVILVAIGIGDAIHLLSHYYDKVLVDPHRPSQDIVLEMMSKLGAPLITTSLTTAIGFFSLYFAEMPPFKVFGIFTVIGILICWLVSITVIPAILTLLKPKVGGYLAKRRSLRVHSEQGVVARVLVNGVRVLNKHQRQATLAVIVVIVISLFGASQLYVDSSWMSDFEKDGDVAIADAMLNEKFDGTIFLNVVIEGKEKGAIKDLVLLNKIEALQNYVEQVAKVGNSLSIVDYLKNMNKNLHAGNSQYDVLPSSSKEVSEYLFLLSISGQPEQLREVLDYDARQTNISFSVKTDHTKDLKLIVDAVEFFVDREFKGLNVNVNLAGSANNSYIWADLLIQSQTVAILFSKLGIFLLASLLFRSFSMGLFTVIPVTVTTLIMAAAAGYLGIPLDVSTTLAAGIAVGVGVDYAVHYIFRYRDSYERLNDHLSAVEEVHRTVGKTIVFNAIVVTVGFFVLFFSQFPPHVKIGYFVVCYMVLSCISALVLLPLLFSYRARWNGRNQPVKSCVSA